MTFQNYSIADNAYGVLNGTVGVGDTTIILKSQENLPASNFILTLLSFDTDGVTILKREKILVGTRSSLTLSGITRGFGGTTAQSFSENDQGKLLVEAIAFQDLQVNKLNVNHTIPNAGNYEVNITNNDTTNNPSALMIYNNTTGRSFGVIQNLNPAGTETLLLQNTSLSFTKTVLNVQTVKAGGSTFFFAKFTASSGVEEMTTIRGDGLINTYSHYFTSNGYIELQKDTGYRIRTDNSGGAGDLQFQDRNTGNIHLQIKRSNGYVSLGNTTAPIGLLDLGLGAITNKLMIYGGGTANGGMGFGIGTNELRAFVGTNSGSNHFARGTFDGVSTYTERMRLTSGGLLLINKTSGTYNLEVSGTAMATTLRTDAGDTLTASALTLASGSYPRIVSSQSNIPLFLGTTTTTSGNAVVLFKNDASSTGNYLFSVDFDKIPKFYNNVANGSVATDMSSVGPTGANATIQGRRVFKDSAGNTRYTPFW